MNRLAHRRIVVTGGASGLGAAIAAVFVTEGASVALLDRDEAGATAKAKELSAFAIVADVTDYAAIQDAAEHTARKLGGIDGVINAAGVLQLKAFEASEPADWQNTIAVNLTGPWNVCRAMLSHLRKSENGIHRQYRVGPRIAARSQLFNLRRFQGRPDRVDAGAGTRACTVPARSRLR